MWVSLTLPKLESEELRTLEKIAEDAEAGPFGTHASFYLSQAGMRELIGAYWKQKLGPEGLRRGDDWQRVKRHSQSLFETEVGFYKQLGLYNLALLDAAVQDYTSFKTRAGQISRLFSSSVPDLLIGRMMHEIDLEKH
jgi:hypothetical protein